MTRVEKLLLLLLPVSFGIGLLSPGAATAPVPADPVFAFTDPAITESSGLVALGGDDPLVVTVNDSGDGARVFTVDPATGDTVGVTRWPGDAVDTEALAPAGEDAVWVGDIGDNARSRDAVTVTKVPVGRGDREVDPTTYELVYPDGAHDAETLLADPVTGRLYVVIKEFVGRVYAAPERLDPDRPNRLEEVGRAIGIATDGAFWPDGRHVVVRNYGQAAVYTWPDLRRVTTVDLPPQPQGEAIAISPEGEVLVSSEGAGAEVLRVDLPEPAAEPDEPAATPGTAPERRPSDSDPPRDPSSSAPLVAGGAAAVVGLVALAAVVVLRRRRDAP